MGFSFVLYSLNRTSDFVEGTCARKKKEKNGFFLLFFTRLIVPLFLEFTNKEST